MTEIATATSRRALLGLLGTAPIAGVAITPASPWASALDLLVEEWGDQAAILRRTKEGRGLSRFRYHNAESFFAGIEEGIVRDRFDVLYQAGIVMQLGISAHLLDVGFDDGWCARHIGLRVAKSLAYANATGFDYDHPEANLLAAILTPYCRWRNPTTRERAYDDGPFSAADIRQLVRGLLERVRHVTGHSRPRGWSARHE